MPRSPVHTPGAVQREIQSETAVCSDTDQVLLSSSSRYLNRRLDVVEEDDRQLGEIVLLLQSEARRSLCIDRFFYSSAHVPGSSNAERIIPELDVLRTKVVARHHSRTMNDCHKCK